MFSETLTPGDIDGDYANLVSLAPTMSNDDAQRQTLGLRMVEAGIISKKTFRDKFMSIPFPDDEKLRIDTEQAEASGELAPAVMLRALMESYPNDWQELIRGTPVEEVARKTGVLPAGGAPPMPPGAPPMPPGMQPPMSPEMMGILPGMEQQMPGVYQEMMGQPLPPDEELMRLAGIPPQMR
jgi:transcriptional regulator of met regulon